MEDSGLIIMYIGVCILGIALQCILLRWIFKVDERLRKQDEIIYLLGKISKNMETEK